MLIVPSAALGVSGVSPAETVGRQIGPFFFFFFFFTSMSLVWVSGNRSLAEWAFKTRATRRLLFASGRWEAAEQHSLSIPERHSGSIAALHFFNVLLAFLNCRPIVGCEGPAAPHLWDEMQTTCWDLMAFLINNYSNTEIVIRTIPGPIVFF